MPTVAESGLPGFEASVWYALLAPAKVPPEVVEATRARYIEVYERITGQRWA